MGRERGIGLGVFLLSIGVIFLLFNVGVISWSIFDALFYLWPLILVVIGVNIIFRKHWVVRLVTWLLFLATLIGFSYFSVDFNGKGNILTSQNPVIVEKPANIQKSTLKLSMGACAIDVASGSDKLLEAEIRDRNIRFASDADTNGNAPTLTFKRNQSADVHWNNSVVNSFRLNKDVPWDINVDTGASKCVLDLSQLKVDSLDYNGGASKFSATFGNKSSLTEIKIDAGVSNIDLTIPESAGIRVRVDKGLSNSNLNGAGWIKKNNVYQTDNYEQAACKFDIYANIGVSNFDVKRSK